MAHLRFLPPEQQALPNRPIVHYDGLVAHKYIYNTEIDQASVCNRIEDCLCNGRSHVIMLIRRTSVTSSPATLVTIRILNVITFKRKKEEMSTFYLEC